MNQLHDINKLRHTGCVRQLKLELAYHVKVHVYMWNHFHHCMPHAQLCAIYTELCQDLARVWMWKRIYLPTQYLMMLTYLVLTNLTPWLCRFWLRHEQGRNHLSNRLETVLQRHITWHLRFKRSCKGSAGTQTTCCPISVISVYNNIHHKWNGTHTGIASYQKFYLSGANPGFWGGGPRGGDGNLAIITYYSSAVRFGV